jgi:cell division protein FtsL
VYQYGNVAVQYQRENKRKPKLRQSQQVQRNQQTQTLVSPNKGISAGEKLIYIFFVIGVVTILSVLLTRNATISQLNYETISLEKEYHIVKEQNMNLRLQVAAASSPESIIPKAKEMGMVLPKSDSTVKVLSKDPEEEAAHHETTLRSNE